MVPSSAVPSALPLHSSVIPDLVRDDGAAESITPKEEATLGAPAE